MYSVILNSMLTYRNTFNYTLVALYSKPEAGEHRAQRYICDSMRQVNEILILMNATRFGDQYKKRYYCIYRTKEHSTSLHRFYLWLGMMLFYALR